MVFAYTLPFVFCSLLPRTASSAVRPGNMAPLMSSVGGERGRRLALVSVPIAWGTYAPAVKLAYSASEGGAPLPGILLSLGQYVVATAVLAGLSASWAPGRPEHLQDKPAASLRAGLELGCYLFIANLFQVRGLATVSAGRGALLVQSTTLLVPILESLRNAGVRGLPRNTLAACPLAFVGLVIMSASEQGVGSAAFTGGDMLILVSAVIYSVHVIRLSDLAPRVPPLTLAVSKATTELCLGLCAVVLLMAAAPDTPLAIEIHRFFADVGSMDTGAGLRIVLASAWCGAVTCGYTMWAQSYGQGSGISPTAANLIYTTQPLWSAAFAWILLGEVLQTQEVVGGAAVLGSLLLAVGSGDTKKGDVKKGSARGLRAQETEELATLSDYPE